MEYGIPKIEEKKWLCELCMLRKPKGRNIIIKKSVRIGVHMNLSGPISTFSHAEIDVLFCLLMT